MRKGISKQTRTKLDLKKVQEVGASVELKGVFLRYCEVNHAQKIIQRKPIDISIVGSADILSVDSKTKTFLAAVEFKLSAKEKKGEEEVFHVNPSFVLFYEMTSNDEFAEKDLKQFAQVNGLYNAWPYFRELVQSMSARMGYPSVTVPLFRVPDSI